ncbi:hypothetical protein IE81DRAFT_84370 [Ceraceosorus guamensis]|uniref:Uncharacterized protein n=1 Tax=Ceraceosorus guamensis TaxID=1522189 RepID=A0A316WAX8_9BASI|nr:hypothetical protein IE81DRAFT_84370 [Ceraceosorus guamensis]PWN46138.1 hypothetical protein IE81DRAFT_84370 [Ceraceosorus guamensis]
MGSLAGKRFPFLIQSPKLGRRSPALAHADEAQGCAFMASSDEHDDRVSQNVAIGPKVPNTCEHFSGAASIDVSFAACMIHQTQMGQVKHDRTPCEPVFTCDRLPGKMGPRLLSAEVLEETCVILSDVRVCSVTQALTAIESHACSARAVTMVDDVVFGSHEWSCASQPLGTYSDSARMEAR